jgi:hypothetical protein
VLGCPTWAGRTNGTRFSQGDWRRASPFAGGCSSSGRAGVGVDVGGVVVVVVVVVGAEEEEAGMMERGR